MAVDAKGLPLASYDAQMAYWIGANVLNTIGAISMLVIAREYMINKALHSPSVLPYVGQLMADWIWLIAYLPHHYINATQGHLQSGHFCTWIAYASAMYFVLGFASGALLSYTTYDIIYNALQRKPPKVSPRTMVMVWIISLVVGVLWAVLMQELDHTGSYRGLFCFMTSTGEYDTGGVFAVLLLMSGSVITLFGYRTYKLVKENSIHRAPAAASSAAVPTSPNIGGSPLQIQVASSPQGGLPPASPRGARSTLTTPLVAGGTGNQSPGGLASDTLSSPSTGSSGTTAVAAATAPRRPPFQSAAAAAAAAAGDPWDIILQRTLLLMFVYFFAAFGELVLVPLNAAKVNTPMPAEIFAGLLMKTRPTLDALIIYYTPSIRRAREARRAAAKGIVANGNSGSHHDSSNKGGHASSVRGAPQPQPRIAQVAPAPPSLPIPSSSVPLVLVSASPVAAADDTSIMVAPLSARTIAVAATAPMVPPIDVVSSSDATAIVNAPVNDEPAE